MTGKIKINISKRDKSPEADQKSTYRDRSPVTKKTQLGNDDNSELQRFKSQFNKMENANDDVKETMEEERGRSKVKEVVGQEDVVETSAMDEMQKLMGFGGFGSTKNKKVEGTNVYGASKKKKSEYRQYMNREKGFNRSLSPTPQEKRQKN